MTRYYLLFDRTLCGNVPYLAPEMVQGSVQSAAVDWWALGVLATELTTRETPWGANDDSEISHLKRIAVHSSGCLALGEQVSLSLADLVEGLLEASPHLRYSEKEVKKHAWLKDINWTRLLRGGVASPLLETAEAQIAKRMDGGPGDPLAEDGLCGDDMEELWLDGFTHTSSD